ncbi:hypothetical protein [Corynebacterium heidelbergense]|uniref:Tail assembly chaperone n=1 Tax=Corynebacterium heidelbergense TaxID=2055947 RepID=A0A364VE91_9CORY|nr:hypothetical protein [Corynebacterium heidelbergense]RAV34924.1 hypothetical protein CWC39_00880 [Corynebacterium heidelbergense]WCZ36063.1 hypothetical protein CHEID_02485 [Corynebacterium heidelbergense]
MADKKTVKAANEAKALVREATGDYPDPIDVTFEVRGQEVTVQCPPTIEDAPFEVPMLIEDEKPMKAFMLMAGDEGRQRMREAGATVKDFTRFIEAWQEAAGLGN